MKMPVTLDSNYALPCCKQALYTVNFKEPNLQQFITLLYLHNKADA